PSARPAPGWRGAGAISREKRRPRAILATAHPALEPAATAKSTFEREVIGPRNAAAGGSLSWKPSTRRRPAHGVPTAGRMYRPAVGTRCGGGGACAVRRLLAVSPR